MVAFVTADMDLDFWAYSEGNMDADFNLESGGDMCISINGQSIDKKMSSIASQSSTSMESIKHQISDIFVDKEGTTGTYYFPDWDELSPSEANLRWSMENYFMSAVLNYYEPRIRDLELEIEVLRDYIGNGNFCQLKMDKAKEQGIDSVECDGITYYLQGEVFIILSDIEEETTEEEYKSNLRKLCDKTGMDSFCLLAESNGE